MTGEQDDDDHDADNVIRTSDRVAYYIDTPEDQLLALTALENIYEGEPDKRQEGDISPSRFRPRYRQLDPTELALHDAIKTKAETLSMMFDKTLNSDRDPVRQGEAKRYHALAMTALEQSVMWAIKALTA